MAYPRSSVVDEEMPWCYHLRSRCVRGAYLCGCGPDGTDYSHRRDLIERQLDDMAAIFAVDVFTYNILDNHFHVIAQFRPDRVRRWSELEVARRSLELMPKATFPEARRLKARSGGKMTKDELMRALATQRRWVEQQRQRLRSPSWFMKAVKETIARRANQEERTTGAFWEGRFKCSVLLDPAAVLGCSIYVDLNQIRAGMASSLEDCPCSSIVNRLRTRQQNQRAGRPLESGLWLRSLELPADEEGPAVELGVTLDQYIELVDATGRQIRANGGRIDPNLEPVLERLNLNPRRWVSVMRQSRQFRGTAFGAAEKRREEAKRRERKWVVGRSGIHLR